MAKQSIPTKRELEAFLQIDGWTKVRSNDHVRYTKTLEDGTVLHTRVSHGRGPAVRSVRFWTKIWRHQLQLSSEAEFWAALKSGTPVVRSVATNASSGSGLPLRAVLFLVATGRWTEEEILAMDPEEARALEARERS